MTSSYINLELILVPPPSKLLTVKDSSANATSAFNGGGAIYINNHRGDAPKVNITNSQFINNKVGTNGETGNGGAIYGSTANLTVENTTFKGNKAANGGAIAMDGQSEFSSKSNTFKRNKAAVAGGAVYVSHGLSNTKKGMTIDSNVKAQMTNSTFKKNSAVLTGDDVAYARYYDETYTGDTSATTLTSDSDFTDVTFADKNRTQLATKDFETELTINNVKYDATKVTGSGEVGATVTAYVGDKEIGSAVVGEDGKYEIEIPGQAGGTEITVKMSKDGYNTVEATKNVLKQIKDFNVDRILPTSTKITGTGMPGAYVKAYVDGEQIGKTAKVGEAVCSCRAACAYPSSSGSMSTPCASMTQERLISRCSVRATKSGRYTLAEIILKSKKVVYTKSF